MVFKFKSLPILIGTTLFLLIPLTGRSQNRSFGPAAGTSKTIETAQSGVAVSSVETSTQINVDISPAIHDFFPFGAYDKMMLNDLSMEEWLEHYTRLFHIMKENNVTTLVSQAYHGVRPDGQYPNDPVKLEALLNLAAENGIKIVWRIFSPVGTNHPDRVHFESGSPYANPTVIAYMHGDEPATEERLTTLAAVYAQLRNRIPTQVPGADPNKPVLTNVVGETLNETGQEMRLGFGEIAMEERDRWRYQSTPGGWPLHAWETFQPDIKIARYYPFRKCCYDLVYTADVGGLPASPNGGDGTPGDPKAELPFHEFARVMEEIYEGRPWWYVAQSMGANAEEGFAQPYWRNPSAAAMKGMLHTALAFGARGILAWPLQNLDGYHYSGSTRTNFRYQRACLLTQETLEPADEKWNAFTEVAGHVAQNAGLLSRHSRGGVSVTVNQNEILVVPRKDPETDKKYIYVVNRNTNESKEGRISFRVPPPTSGQQFFHARNLYSGANYPIRYSRIRANPDHFFSVTLAPGEGQFIELLPAF